MDVEEEPPARISIYNNNNNNNNNNIINYYTIFIDVNENYISLIKKARIYFHLEEIPLHCCRLRDYNPKLTYEFSLKFR